VVDSNKLHYSGKSFIVHGPKKRRAEGPEGGGEVISYVMKTTFLLQPGACNIKLFTVVIHSLL
jgi:hypothetical protein